MKPKNKLVLDNKENETKMDKLEKNQLLIIKHLKLNLLMLASIMANLLLILLSLYLCWGCKNMKNRKFESVPCQYNPLVEIRKYCQHCKKITVMQKSSIRDHNNLICSECNQKTYAL